MFRVPKANEDLRHIDTGLSAEDRAAVIHESKRLQAIRALGSRWLLARDYDVHYRPALTRKAA